MKKLLMLAAGIAFAAMGAMMTPTPSAAVLHCDEACSGGTEPPGGQCQYDQYSFSVCVGGTWFPCEEGPCGPV